MLILTRRINETLVIGEDVYLTMLGVKGNQVRIGIAAPKDIPVHREEIFLKLKEQQGILNGEGGELDCSLAQVFRAHQKAACARHMTH